jgi:hypothetical protein
MIAVIFQIIFHVKIYQNDIIFIFLKLFLRLAYQNDSKHINFFNFLLKK